MKESAMHPISHTKRAGISQLEILVAAALVGVLSGLLSMLAYQLQRVQRDARNYQIAVHELTNQISRLKAESPANVESAIQKLEPSELTKLRLIAPVLSGQVVRDTYGVRVELLINWERIGPAEPVRMTGWIQMPPPTTDVPAQAAAEETSTPETKNEGGAQ